MNYCQKCQSLYAQPGTCNCFARVAQPVQPVPAQPFVPIVPTLTPPPGFTGPWWGVRGPVFTPALPAWTTTTITATPCSEGLVVNGKFVPTYPTGVE